MKSINKKQRPRKQKTTDGHVRRIGRIGRIFRGTEDYLAKYHVMTTRLRCVVVAWVIAAWMADLWDRFPHLVISSPQKRCGKTRLLQLLEVICPCAENTAGMSPAVLYRIIKDRLEKTGLYPTLMLDEAQSIGRRGSESSEVTRELLNAGIDKDAKVLRCGGRNNDEIHEFKFYSPKIMALIGQVDGVLADRCLNVRLDRKTDAEQVEQYRSKLAREDGEKVLVRLEKWIEKNKTKVERQYERQEPFDIGNDRMAEVLLPLQSVLIVMGETAALEELRQYADAMDNEDTERLPADIRLLKSIKEVFSNGYAGKPFITTANLMNKLYQMDDESWDSYNPDGSPITPKKVASLLKPYDITPSQNRAKTQRGYYRSAFKIAWDRYTPEKASEASNASEASGG